MKAQLAMLLAIGACVAADDPEVGTRRQDERIDVHGCRPGTIEVGEGADFTCKEDPWPWPGGWPTGPGDVGGERSPGGPGHGPGGADEGRGVGGAPGVLVRYSTIGGTICKCICLSIGVTVCTAMGAACAAGTVMTIGGVTVPCIAAALAACNAGAWGTQVCTDWLCPKE